MHFHFVRSMMLGAKNVVLHRPSVHFGLGTVSCGNALLPSGRNVTSTNTGEAATIRQPEEHPGRLMDICWFPRRGPSLPNSPNALYSSPRLVNSPLGGPCGPRLRITALSWPPIFYGWCELSRLLSLIYRAGPCPRCVLKGYSQIIYVMI